MDHICYRTSTQQEYQELKRELEAMGDLLIESEIGGRLIANYKLKTKIPILLKNSTMINIQVIEIPAPKAGRAYASGLEHVEFVVPDLVTLQREYPELSWDVSGLKKEFNADLRLQLDGVSVKFHTSSLESVITEEKKRMALQAT